MKTNNIKEENGGPKTETSDLAVKAAEAKKQAKTARERARIAKAKFKEARKAFKQARKIAKQARKQAKVLAKAIKAQTRPLPKAASKQRPRQSRGKAKPEQNRVTPPRIVIEKPVPPSTPLDPEMATGTEAARSQTPNIGP